jgi:hypothetical protein
VNLSGHVRALALALTHERTAVTSARSAAFKVRLLWGIDGLSWDGVDLNDPAAVATPVWAEQFDMDDVRHQVVIEPYMRITLRCETRATRARSTLLHQPALRAVGRTSTLPFGFVAQEALLATTARIAAEADALRLNEGSGLQHHCTLARARPFRVRRNAAWLPVCAESPQVCFIDAMQEWLSAQNQTLPMALAFVERLRDFLQVRTKPQCGPVRSAPNAVLSCALP